jgi:CheY-like chemotaxis protein
MGNTVFVSYQRADALFAAHALGYALRHAGHEAFVDTGSIAGGELYQQAIGNAIARTNVMLALVGPTFNFARLSEPASVIAYEWRRAQFHGCSVVPVLVDGGAMPTDAVLPAHLRWFTRRNAYALRRESLSSDIDALVDAVPLLAATPRGAARVLWVDDHPANNEEERRALREHGIGFDNVVSTAEALEQIANGSYDLVITDLGREGSSDRSPIAGAALLQDPALRQGAPPVIVYGGIGAVKQKALLMRQGAIGVTNVPRELVELVLRTLGRTPEVAQEPSREF